MIELGKVEYYLLAINVIGAVVYLINMFLYRHTSNGQINVIVTITSLLGGSAGMLLMILFFDRKIVFAIDKVNARAHRSRIRIVTLLGLSFAGGSIGGLISMYLFRHKTQKDYFTVGMPLIIIMQIVVIFYVMNAGW